MHGIFASSAVPLVSRGTPLFGSHTYGFVRNLVLSALLFVGATAMAAQTFTVTTTADDATTPPAGSLRKAVIDAADGDTIDFNASVTGAITLADAELVLDKNLTITGPGAAVLAISGNQQSRVFRVPAGKTVAISGLTIRDGKVADGADVNGGPGEGGQGESGGGVLNQGSLALTACWLTGNIAGVGGDRSGGGTDKAGNGGSGGAISSSGTLTLVSCTLADNRAGTGGGRFTGSGEFSATGGNGGSGGAIHITSGNLQLQNCTIRQNGAGKGGAADAFGRNGNGGDGGGICIEGGTALLKGSSIVQNGAGWGGWVPTEHAPGSGGKGGGISIGLADVNLDTCTISGNAAGGVDMPSFFAAGGSGGGLFCKGGGVHLVSCTVSDNIAGENYNYPGYEFELQDGAGGGICVSSGTVALRNSIVAANRDTSPSSIISKPCIRDVFGTFVSEGHNLIGQSDGSVGFRAGVNGDIVGSRASPVDPLLGLLANYGGSTVTYALRPGSPAIEAGDDSILGNDQRGQPRLAGAHVDIGAFERDPSQASAVSFETNVTRTFEHAGVVGVTVKRTGDTSTWASVEFSTSGGAVAGVDYTPVSGTLEFEPGQTEAVINIPLLDDDVPDGWRRIDLTLVPSSTAVLYPYDKHTINVEDQENGFFTFAATSSTVSEDAGSVQITVLRQGSLAGSVAISFDTSNGTAISPNDFVGTHQVLRFEPGDTEKTITIPINPDVLNEGDEKFVVELNPNALAPVGQPGTHEVTIKDVPVIRPAVRFGTAASTVAEGAGNVQITVVRSLNTEWTVSVSYTTTNISALAGYDYISTTGTLTFEPGVTQQTITVPIINDTDFEGDKTFGITLSNPSINADLSSPTNHKVTIRSDDDGYMIVELGGTSTVREASGSVVVTLYRFGEATSPTVQVSAQAGSAKDGADYIFESTTVTFAPHETQKSVSISIVDDTADESDEQFSLVLSNPGRGVSLGIQSVHTITIQDDAEDLPEFRKASYHGLMVTPDDTTHEYGGINIKTTDSGQLTGTLQVFGKTVRFRGRFSETGTFIHAFSRKSPGIAEASFLLQLDNGGATISGTVSTNRIVFEANLKRDVVATYAARVAETNSYTALLQTDLYDLAGPGFLRARVLPTGKVTLSGMLSDGTRLSGSSHLAEDRSFPILFPAYVGKVGYLAGTARIISDASLPLSGELHWKKPANGRAPYPYGLREAPVELLGNVYTPPPRRQRALDDFDATQGIAFFETRAAGADPVSINAMWNQDNTFRITLPAVTQTAPPRITLQPKTGLFTGTLRDAENHPNKFFGICIQQSEAGADQAVGFLLGGETPGRVELVPQPSQQ